MGLTVEVVRRQLEDSREHRACHLMDIVRRWNRITGVFEAVGNFLSVGRDVAALHVEPGVSEGWRLTIQGGGLLVRAKHLGDAHEAAAAGAKLMRMLTRRAGRSEPSGISG